MKLKLPSLTGFIVKELTHQQWIQLPFTTPLPQKANNCFFIVVKKEHPDNSVEESVVIYCSIYTEFVNNREVVRVNYYDNVFDGIVKEKEPAYRNTQTATCRRTLQLSINMTHYLQDFYKTVKLNATL